MLIALTVSQPEISSHRRAVTELHASILLMRTFVTIYFTYER